MSIFSNLTRLEKIGLAGTAAGVAYLITDVASGMIKRRACANTNAKVDKQVAEHVEKLNAEGKDVAVVIQDRYIPI